MLILFLIALLIRTLIPHLAGAHHGHIELALTNTSIITPSGLKSFGLHPTGLYRLFNQKKMASSVWKKSTKKDTHHLQSYTGHEFGKHFIFIQYPQPQATSDIC